MGIPPYRDLELSIPDRGQNQSRTKFKIHELHQQSMLEQGAVGGLRISFLFTVNPPLNLTSVGV